MKWHKRFFWLLLLFLPTQLGLHFWPDWATVLGRRVDYLAPTVYLTDILLFAILLFWFKESISKKYTPSFILYSLFFILIGTNIYGADNQMVAIYKWGKVTEFVLLGWYIVRTKPKLSSLSFPLAAGVFYSSVLAIAQFILQHSIGGPLWWLGERTFTVDTPGIARFESCQLSAVSCQLFLRSYATFPHPNVLGGYIAAILPLIISNIQFPISNQKKKFIIFKITTIIAGVVALILTFSRSAIGIGILALAFVFFQKKKILFFLAILFLTFSVFRFPFTFFEESVVVRQQLNVAAIKLWQSSPLFGVGLGNFLVRLPEALPTRTIYFLQPVHNIYLLLLSEMGIVGLIFFLWFMWLLVSREWRMENGEWKHKPEFISILYSLFSILLLGLVDHYPLTLQQGQLLLTVLAGMSVFSVH